MKIVPIFFLGVCLSGCSLFSPGLKTETETMKAKKDGKTQEIGMFATEASSRVIIANVNAGKFCAEPPPETQTTESSSFRLLLQAALDSNEDEAKVEAFRAFNQGVRQLYKRSHTNQLYRDSSYYLCQSYLNGALTDKNLSLFLKMLVEGPQSDEQKKIANQAQNLINQIDTENLDVKNAYLAAQLLLSKWAFASLKDEVSAFYNAELKINEGKAAAYSEGLDQLTSAIKQLEANIEALASSSKETQEQLKQSNEKLEKVIQSIDKTEDQDDSEEQ